MNVHEDAIFCAEQINVPLDLPEILKSFTKSVIRENPEDIIAFAAQYFEHMANDLQEMELPLDNVIDLYRKLLEEDPDRTYTLPRDIIASHAGEFGFVETAAELFSHEQDPAEMDYRKFIVLLISYFKLNILGAIEPFFDIFAEDESSLLTVSEFVVLTGFLLREMQDSDDILEEIKDALNADGEDANERKISFEEFAELPVSDKLR
ncbi:hypothetical protein BLNAU_811 [Blattamonas nauphoetae]|uniref:RIIa domain-containing protein n=1 Tax=Blattamonas nauphoetae TaxID=2049346 RepID=A0ABQ9YKV3_9EUKA|nr:hypothetical protein BLNAU_811 [Blattamonas nauphoetae]